MVLIEMMTKHYDILGERTPVELTFYDNGDGCKVVATYNTLAVSTTVGENMDRDITATFESMILTNGTMHNKNYTQNNDMIITIIENPDDEGEDSIMIAYSN